MRTLFGAGGITLYISKLEIITICVALLLVVGTVDVPPSSTPAVPLQVTALPNRAGGGSLRARVTVSFLDVGDANAVLVQTDTKQVLVDTGGLFMGEVVTEFLRSASVTRLNYLIVSYPSAPHAGGGLALLHEIGVETFVAPAVDSRDWVYRRLNDLLSYYKVEVIQSRRDLVLDLGSGVSLRPLGPFAEVFAEGQFSPGDQSLAWLLTVGNVRFLLASDLTAAGEHLLVRVVPDLRAEVLLVASHGDRQSTSTVFLETLNPRFAVISSAGLTGMLSQQVLSRLKAKGIVTLRTDVLGHIIIRSDGRNVAWYSQKRGDAIENPDNK